MMTMRRRRRRSPPRCSLAQILPIFLLVSVLFLLHQYYTFSVLLKPSIPPAPQDTTTAGIYALASRRLAPSDFRRITFHLTPATSLDSFTYILTPASSVSIAGTSLSSLALGLSTLYERACNVSLVSWADVSPPAPCLHLARPTSHSETALFRYRYALNAVTFAYSGYMWSEAEWMDQLDWLALSGVNLALAHVGFEALFRRALRQTLRVDPLRSFFTCESLFAWNRMGNIKSVGGPPNETYLASQLALQHRLLARMVELGIQPILHGFNGFVPDEALDEMTPRLFASQWAGFSQKQSNVQRLPLSHARFAELAEAVARAQLDEFRAELASLPRVFFSLDVYNENAPNAGEDFAKVGPALVEPLQRAVGPGRQTKVVTQLWFLAHFRQFWTRKRARAFLDGFPRGSLVLLDLHGEHRPQWERIGLDGEWAAKTGNELIWCVLHNFGGANSVAGEVRFVFDQVREQAGHAGVGVAPEGFGANEVEFKAVLAAAWSGSAGQFDAWLERWVAARYRGVMAEAASKAWRCAMGTVYARPEYIRGFGPTKSVIEMRPGRHMKHHEFQPTAYAYLVEDWAECVRLLLRGGRHSQPRPAAWAFDVVDWTKQVLADVALKLEEDRNGQGMLELIDDLERVLQMDTRFVWQLEGDKQAKALVTFWHEDNDGALHDYASRLLGGSLLLNVYRKRWEAFLNGRRGGDKELEMRWVQAEVVQQPLQKRGKGVEIEVVEEVLMRWV